MPEVNQSTWPLSSEDLPDLPLFPEGTGITDVFHVAGLLHGYWDPNSAVSPAP